MGYKGLRGWWSVDEVRTLYLIVGSDSKPHCSLFWLLINEVNYSEHSPVAELSIFLNFGIESCTLSYSHFASTKMYSSMKQSILGSLVVKCSLEVTEILAEFNPDTRILSMRWYNQISYRHENPFMPFTNRISGLFCDLCQNVSKNRKHIRNLRNPKRRREAGL